MSEQNAAFEKLYGEIPHDIQSKLNYQEAQSHFNVGYRAATAEANKRMAELEGEVAELKVSELEALRNSRFYGGKALELKVSNNDLREALNQLSALKLSSAPHIQKLEAADKIVTKALKIKPAESLQAHDDDVLDKLRPTRWTQKMNHAWNLAIPDLHKAFDDLIEALKGT